MTAILNANGRPMQRTERGLAYDSYVKQIREDLSHGDAEAKAALNEAKEALLRTKLTPGTVQQSSLLTDMSVMYANDDFIGTRLMPVVGTNGSQSGSFYTYTKRDRFAAPSDDMSTRAKANEVTQGRSLGTYSLSPRALANHLDDLVRELQDAPLNEMLDLVEAVVDSMELKREQRLAAVLHTAGTYGANTAAIAAADRWNSAGGGNPGSDVDAAKAACWAGMGPGSWVGFMSLDVWNVLKRHPLVLDGLKYSKPGSVASRQEVAAYLELDDLLVGASRNDTANEGQAAAYARIWNDVFGIVRVANRPGLRNATFGATLQGKPNRTDTWYEIADGSQGAWWTRVSRQDQEKVICADCGYLLTTPI